MQVNVKNRIHENTPIRLNINETVQKLSILIENQGRISYGNYIEDRKVKWSSNIFVIIHIDLLLA